MARFPEIPSICFWGHHHHQLYLGYALSKSKSETTFPNCHGGGPKSISGLRFALAQSIAGIYSWWWVGPLIT